MDNLTTIDKGTFLAIKEAISWKDPIIEIKMKNILPKHINFKYRKISNFQINGIAVRVFTDEVLY